MTCEEVRLALGAHALGALEPRESEEIDFHLATCEECGAELVELAGVAGFLGKVSERDVELVTAPPRRVLERLLTDRARRSRRSRALMAVAAAAVVVVGGGVVWSALPDGGSSAAAPAAEHVERFSAEDGGANQPKAAQDSTESESSGDTEDRVLAREAAPTPIPSPASTDAQARSSAEASPTSTEAPARATAAPKRSPEPSAQGRAFRGTNDGYRATVSAAPDGPRTVLMVQVEGVPVGTGCTLVIVAGDGSREPAGTWTINRRTYEENQVFRQETNTRIADIAAFEITGDDGEVLVRVPVNGGN